MAMHTMLINKPPDAGMGQLSDIAIYGFLFEETALLSL